MTCSNGSIVLFFLDIKMPAPHTERRYKRQADGFYHVKGTKYRTLVGRRSQVGQGHAYKTSGGLVKEDLVKNASGEWVSKVKSIDGKLNNRLLEHGFGYTPGKFGAVKMTKAKAKSLANRPKTRSADSTRPRLK